MSSVLDSDERSRPLSVSELTRLVKDELESSFPKVWVRGEVSNLRQPQSGHVYFTLKDRASQIAVVMFRSAFRRCRMRLADGMEVVARGRLSVYEPRGSYQIVATSLSPVGEGDLDAALRKLVERLAGEGLFDDAHKQPLPFAPTRIAAVTSASGAAVRDIISTIHVRFPPASVGVFAVPVQGAEAPGAVANAIRVINADGGCDVIIVSRGGGSAEDLSAFNTEEVARAIFASRIPVVSAVGHEIDLLVSDLVADVRARTPTHAGELVVPDAREVTARLRELIRSAGKGLQFSLERAEYRLKTFARAVSPRVLVSRLDDARMRVDDLMEAAQLGARNVLAARQARCDAARRQLGSLNPMAVLARGYSVTLDEQTGQVIMDASTVQRGQAIVTRLAEGVVSSVVKGAQHGRKASSEEL